ncbi:MAG: hypothetical protein E6J87_14125, partial [Deltaproteobacteria bacterium]
MGSFAGLGIVLTHHVLPPLCLLAALLAAGPLYAGVEKSEPAPARVEPAPNLELALRALPPGIRAAVPEAPAPFAVEYTVD